MRHPIRSLTGLLIAVFILTGYSPKKTNKDILKANDIEKNEVALQKLKIDVKISGNIATTIWEMVFYNNSNRVAEKDLNFPLPDGVALSRYAIDINGKMREAVPVEKEKGQVVFENIERRRVDPGLIEKTEGNNFHTRIYPVPANGSRTVIIGYDEELKMGKKNSLQYRLPLQLKQKANEFQLNITVLQSSFRPDWEEDGGNNFQFDEWNNNYTTSVTKSDFKLNQTLVLSLPKVKDVAEVTMQKSGNHYFFLANTYPKSEEKIKELPHNLTILWDVSLSRLSHNTKKELALLDSYIGEIKDVNITVIPFSNTIQPAKNYTIANGKWEQLKKDIQSLIYDGATQLGNIDLSKLPGDEFLLFSDGHSTFGKSEMKLSNKPVYCINSSVSADYSNLKYMAQKTGGSFIDLNVLPEKEANHLLKYQSLQFLGIKEIQSTEEIYPGISVQVSEEFSLAGICYQPEQTITMQFGYGNRVISEKNIHLNYDKQQSKDFNVERIWAQKKLADLDIHYEQNKNLIQALGKRYRLVTRNTSLIVLETVNDYVQYEIEPPAELREEFDRIMKQRSQNNAGNNLTTQYNAENYFNTLYDWWNKETKYVMPIKKDSPVVINNNPQISAGQAIGVDTSSNVYDPTWISGKVIDQNKQPIVGASVMIKGTRTGTSTDVAGKFKLRRINGKNTIVISAVGFNKLEYNSRVNIFCNITLTQQTQALNEVVVVGYGTRNSNSDDDEDNRQTRQSRKALSYSVSTINANEVNSTGITSTQLQGRVAGLSVTPGSSANIRLRGTRSVSANNGLTDIETNEEEKSEPSASISIADIKLDYDYLDKLNKASKEKKYEKYLAIREQYIFTPSFYFNVANLLFKEKDSVNALKVLSNVAELGIEDYETYKLLGYKLKEAGDFENELAVFKKVLDWRPQEPQSYRDYALALEDAGSYQSALDTLYLALTKNYNSNIAGMYNGIEETIITEINRLITLYGDNINYSSLPKKIIASLPVDVRVVLNWNMNDTDIDLWVTDPNEEKCYYGHNQTNIGGRISRDFTRGYGPEQFLLKKATKGNYKVEINFFGNQRQKISGPTAVMAEIYTHYADGKEQRKIITLQMEKGKNGTELVGEFSF